MKALLDARLRQQLLAAHAQGIYKVLSHSFRGYRMLYVTRRLYGYVGLGTLSEQAETMRYWHATLFICRKR